LLRRARKILVMVAAGAALAAGCGGDGGDEGSEAARPAASATLAAPASSNGDGAGTGDVRIANFAFAPATVRARAGQRVTWEHQDAGVTHTVTAVKGEFRSGELDEGDEFSHVFPAAGTFAYRCAIHPDMRGRVRVGG
jgi:plastocyanin